jgi:hypothetical protein
MAQTLKIGRGFSLPLDYVTNTAAIIAKRRVGKTYTGAVFGEEMVAAGIPWYALDPTGAWWGLRSSADGQRAGLPVVVLGGEHGDIPITEHDGKMIADLIVEEPSWYVIDLSEVDENHSATVRFVTAFFGRLYGLKNKQRDPLHGFWDEADMFAPQRPGPDETRMLGSAEAIVRRGGIRGLGTTLITQRGAVLNKNVLTQLDILFALRTISPQDRAAIDEYLKDHASKEERAEIMGSLPSLGLGEMQVYGPGEDPPILKRVRVRERRTFNSSATPKAGERRVEPRKLASIDLDKLRGRMEAAVEKAKADDPKLLRKRITELERQVSELSNTETPEPVRVEVPVPLLPPGNRIETVLLPVLEMLPSTLEKLRSEVSELLETARPAAPEGRSVQRRHSNPVAHDGTPRRRAAATSSAPVAQNGDGPALKAGARRILAEMSRVHPLRLTRSQVGLATGLKIRGGTFTTYWGTLKREGLIEENGDDAGVTPEGLEFAGVEQGAPMTAAEIREMWRSKLKRGAREMLDVLVEAYPSAVVRDELALRLDMAVRGGTFTTYLGTLRRNGLVLVEAEGIQAHPDLFVGAT